MKRGVLVSAVRRALPGPTSLGVGHALVTGLSGGADSVALLDVLALVARERGFRLVAAHLDHRLRPSSGDDAAFCARLCAQLGVHFRNGTADVRGRAQREGGGIEEAARRERYAFLRTVQGEERAQFLSVAHTRDDQAETFLLRLLRGAGSSGLTAMQSCTGDLLRPLLSVSRQEVLAHLAASDLEWREDPSNQDPAFLRNRVRHELIPYLEARFNPSIRSTLARTADLLGDEDALVRRLASDLRRRAGRREGATVVMDRAALNAAPRPVARAAVRLGLEETGGLRGIAALHVERILELAAAPAPSGRRLPLPGGRRVAFRFGEVAIGPRPSVAVPFDLPLPVPGRVLLPAGGFLEAHAPGTSRGEGTDSGQGREVVVSAPVDRGLVVRTRRPGDRAWKGGRQVSLSRLLMQERIPAEARDGWPLVAAGDEVLWVAGLAASISKDADTRRLVALRLVGGDEGALPQVGNGILSDGERKPSPGAREEEPLLGALEA